MNGTGTPQPVQSDLLMEALQRIEFSADGLDSSVVCASEVLVVPSAGDHEHGSSKVKMHTMVDYTWEERFYTGQLLAVHIGGVFIAYGIKAMNKATSKAEGVVKVVNKETNERTLIKGMQGAIQDIAFAHIPHQIVIGCLDQKGNLFVFEVEKGEHSLQNHLLLHILPDPEYTPQPDDFYRVMWCPFIPEVPEEGEVEEPADGVDHLLALSRGRKVELWNVTMVTNKHSSGPVAPRDVAGGFLEILDYEKPIVDAAFAPDGTALATAGTDGEIKFYQVYMQNNEVCRFERNYPTCNATQEEPRCLHQWTPHKGKPLSSLFFLDNHKNYNPEVQFWKFAITGANNNSELKVWSCESWKCLQTLAFDVSRDRQIKLNAALDLASGYLLLSDFHHKILYVLQIYVNSEMKSAAIVSISEFLLPYPILSFGISDAGVRHFKSKNLEEICDDENDEDGVLGVLIRMYLVQPKSLQECQIAFIPPDPGSVDRTKLIPIDSDLYYTILDGVEETIHPSHANGDINVSSSSITELANHSSLQLNLMTPDAFNSPVKHETSGSSLIKIHQEETYSTSNTVEASPHLPDEPDSHMLAGVVVEEAPFGFASGGSSPSREVQEILGENNSSIYQQVAESTSGLYQAAVTTADIASLPCLPLPDDNVGSSNWSEIPILKASEVAKNEEARRSANQPDGGASGDSELWRMNQRLENTLGSMIRLMNSVMQTVEEQAAEVKRLKEELHQQNAIRDQTLLREVGKLIADSSREQMMLTEKLLAAKDTKQQQDALVANVTQSVVKFLSTKFMDSINSEISRTVFPSVFKQIEALKQQIHAELTQKLTTTDHLLKENINKLVYNKSVMEALSQAVVTSISPIISQCYKDYFTTVALPSFEKSCTAMFLQINETFSKGTREFVGALDAQTHRIAEKNREQSVTLQALSETLRNSTTEMSVDMKKSVTAMETHVMEAVTRALTVQQAALEGSVIAAVRSRAETPAPHAIDLQAQINQLISQGQINAAFQQALSAADLRLVMMVCEKVDPQQVFAQMPCPLQQHVLLSLVQQLSADMNNHTEIKHKYLQEALMNLDVTNSVTREHLPAVLTNLQRQLQAYITGNPQSRLTRGMRLLLMASTALLNDCVNQR